MAERFHLWKVDIPHKGGYLVYRSFSRGTRVVEYLKHEKNAQLIADILNADDKGEVWKGEKKE